MKKLGDVLIKFTISSSQNFIRSTEEKYVRNISLFRTKFLIEFYRDKICHNVGVS